MSKYHISSAFIVIYLINAFEFGSVLLSCGVLVSIHFLLDTVFTYFINKIYNLLIYIKYMFDNE